MLKKVDRPTINVEDVVTSLLESYIRSSKHSRTLTKESTNKLLKFEKYYIFRGTNFYNLSPRELVEELNKKAMIHFYEKKIVGKRIGDIHNKILKTNKKICPICGGVAATVDHVLPKESFVQFAITPINLIPMCNLCNKKKGANYSHREEYSAFHPYFDDVNLHDYLKATYIIDREEKFRLNYKVDNSMPPKYTFNFYTLFELNKVCAIKAQQEVGGINNWKERVVKDNSEVRVEVIKKIVYKMLKNRKEGLNVYMDPAWKIVLYKVIIENFDTFYEYVLEEE